MSLLAQQLALQSPEVAAVEHGEKATVSHQEVSGQLGDAALTHWFNWKLLMNMSVVGLAACLFGYASSFIAPQLSLPTFIQKYQSDSAGSNFTARNLDLILSVPIVGSAAGGLLAAVPLQAHLGEKRAFLIAYGTCCIPGSVLQLLAPDLAALVVGRIWNAFGVAVLLATCPLYMVDLAPVHVRARSIGIIVFLNLSISVPDRDIKPFLVALFAASYKS